MPWGAAATVAGSAISAGSASAASDRATKAILEGSEAAISEQRRQFETSKALSMPFLEAGRLALNQQRILLGLGGESSGGLALPSESRRFELEREIDQLRSDIEKFASEPAQTGRFRKRKTQASIEEDEKRRARLNEINSELQTLDTADQSVIAGRPQLSASEQQRNALEALSQSPGQIFLRERAQKNLLRNAAAIGGLGGGNVRSALVQQGVGFAQQDLENQFARLGQLAGQGQAATTNVNQLGSVASGNIAGLLQGGAQARSTGILGKNQAFQQGLSGVFTGLAQSGVFDQTQSVPPSKGGSAISSGAFSSGAGLEGFTF